MGTQKARASTQLDFGTISGLIKTNTSGVESTLKCNFSASAGPAGTDDGTQGYSVGSFWFDTTNKALYACSDTTTNAAVWTRYDNTVTTPVSESNGGTGSDLSGTGPGLLTQLSSGAAVTSSVDPWLSSVFFG